MTQTLREKLVDLVVSLMDDPGNERFFLSNGDLGIEDADEQMQADNEAPEAPEVNADGAGGSPDLVPVDDELI